MQMRMRFVADYDVDYIAAAPTATFPPPIDQLSVRRSVSPSPCLSVCPSVSLSVSGCLEQCEIKNCNKLQAKRQINYKIEERERPRERERDGEKEQQVNAKSWHVMEM